MKKKLLIIGSSQGIYGGIEAFMIAVAEAAVQWPEFETALCFKLVKGAQPTAGLIESAGSVCNQVHYVQRGSFQLAKLIGWADILHVQNIPPDIIFFARLLSKKVFLTVHNRRLPEVNLHNIAWQIAINFCHRRWYNSNFVWNTWEPKLKSAKSDFIPTVCRLPNAWCPPEDRKGFLFIGRWIENKGIEEILKAYSLGGFDSTSWPLTILGDGPIRPSILALANDLNLTQLIMPGFVDDEAKAKYLSSARWILAPARTQEDLGLTPIEARSVGVPSIVTRDGGLPESGGPAALIVEPGNVRELMECMRTATLMSEDEYRKQSELAKCSLKSFLRPLDFYRHAYLSDNE